MPERSINCQAFQISIDSPRGLGNGLAIRNSLEIAEINGAKFIDPQKNPRRLSPEESALPENLHLRLSKSTPPKQLGGHIRELSLSEAILTDVKDSADLDRFRVREPQQRSVGNFALIGLVNSKTYIPTTKCDELVTLGSFAAFDSKDDRLDVSLVLIPEKVPFWLGEATNSFAFDGHRIVNTEKRFIDNLAIWAYSDRFQATAKEA